MKIEKLEPSQHRQGRWLVWLEDGTLLRLGEGDVVALSLYAGKELDDRAGEALTRAASRSRLRERAIALLSARPMSRRELVDKLSAPPRPRKGSAGEPDQPSQPREELEAAAWEVAGYLNEADYAAQIVRVYSARGFGEKKLRDELYRRGGPRELWDQALEETEGQESQLDRLVEKKLRGAQPTRENLKKASDFLARRGFGWDLNCQAILIRLLVELNRQVLDTPGGLEVTEESSGIVADVLRYINENFNNEISLDSLSDHFFISKYHLSREFKRLVGTSVYRYIIQKRLIMAKQKMLAGMSPTDVYCNCGFGDYANFYRAFRGEYGISPKEFCEEAFRRR